jgi:hypothetical protein
VIDQFELHVYYVHVVLVDLFLVLKDLLACREFTVL